MGEKRRTEQEHRHAVRACVCIYFEEKATFYICWVRDTQMAYAMEICQYFLQMI